MIYAELQLLLCSNDIVYITSKKTSIPVADVKRNFIPDSVQLINYEEPCNPSPMSVEVYNFFSDSIMDSGTYYLHNLYCLLIG